AITQKLIHLMLGEIEVQSELGKGTNFSFVVQLDKAEMQIPQKFKSGHMPRNLMMVGGTRFFQNNLEKQLGAWDIHVQPENDTEKAFEQMLDGARNRQNVEVVIVDNALSG